MSSFAPTTDARDFLLQQQKEEDSHLELLTDYVRTHMRTDAPVSLYLKKLDRIMLEAIEKEDYIASVFIQNFIVEGLNISLLRELEHHADGTLSELCTTILREELGHMEFGVNEIKRILKETTNPKLERNLLRLQRKVLFYSIGLSIDLAREAKDLSIPVGEFAEKTVSEHALRIKEVNLPLPLIDRVLYKLAVLFLKAI